MAGWLPVRRTARERPTGPLQGFKLAFAMVSADGTRIGFSGVAMGRSQVYDLTADAVCVQTSRHRCPSGWCDCGFYCFHSMDDARALACDPDYQQSVLLEVSVTGRYVRYEKGLRYARQTVRAVRVGRCGCGRPASAFADAGGGTVGWRRLLPVCVVCAGLRPVLTLAAFGRLAGDVSVEADPQVAAFASGFGPLPASPEPLEETALVPLLAAEVALLQARLDELQAQLDRISRGPAG